MLQSYCIGFVQGNDSSYINQCTSTYAIHAQTITRLGAMAARHTYNKLSTSLATLAQYVHQHIYINQL
jgi:hypothetical protein